MTRRSVDDGRTRIPAANEHTADPVPVKPPSGGEVVGFSDDHILVVEADRRVGGLLARVLTGAGLRVSRAGSAGEARRSLEDGGVDLVLLTRELPDADGLDLLAEIRESSDVPMIVLSIRDSEGDRILSLGAGADDYVIKPFSPAEIVARVGAVLRRCAGKEPPASIVHGDLEIDTRARKASRGGREVDLAPREFELLATLAAQPRRAFSRAELLRDVWDSAPEHLGTATVTEHVRRLRRKLGDRPAGSPWIVTVPGVGYRFDP